MPELERLRKTYEPQGIRFLALSLDPDEQLVRDAAHRLDLGATVAIAAGEVLAPLGVNQVPSVIFVNSEGMIVAAGSGPRKRSSVESRLKELISR